MSHSDENGSDSIPQIDWERLITLLEIYLPKLVKRCELTIDKRFESKFDQNDIVGTVKRTLVKRVRAGTIKICHDEVRFWTLLTTLADRKISNKVRFFTTIKNDIDRQSNNFANLQSLLSREPGPEEATSFVDMLEWLSNRVEPEEMEILHLRLEGKTNREIADTLGVVERTISRKFRVIKEKLEPYYDVLHPQ
jgi:RNA polymerase sigma factor (sigma-70 family)